MSNLKIVAKVIQRQLYLTIFIWTLQSIFKTRYALSVPEGILKNELLDNKKAC